MCGICGIWGVRDGRAVKLMVGAMHHRGPDDCGVLIDDPATLGMTRLAIIDTSRGGHQPMQSADKSISLVYNGELYNFREERKLLEAKGHHFSSSSDTEVVLRMYEAYGDDFLLRMRGMFALAVLDKRGGPGRERLLLARDQIGIKPLLYARVGNQLIFASEIKALLASGLINPQVDSESLRLLLNYGSIYQPRTIIRGVKMLLPAHRLIVQGDNEKLERYWSLELNRDHSLRSASYEEHVERVDAVLRDSVRRQMVADVPLGAFLSGGLDSALTVALMARETSGHRVKTFSVGFEAEGAGIDETDLAARTADHLGTDHTRVMVRGTDVRDRISAIACALDQPTVDGINSYFVSAAARQAVTVAISGTGGDDVFAGYPWIARMAFDQSVYDSQPAWRVLARGALAPAVRLSFLNSLSSDRVRARLDQLRYSSDFRTRYASAYHVFDRSSANALLHENLRHDAQVDATAYEDLEILDELPAGSAIERATGVCLRGYTNAQLLRDIDAASMAHSLEVRVPYLDPDVIDVALSLPDSSKQGAPPHEWTWEPRTYREAGTKLVLLDVAKPYLPSGYDQEPKRGFGMPFASWLRGPLGEVFNNAVSETAVRNRGLFASSAVESVKSEFLAGSQNWSRPWLLMMIELWAREMLDRAPALAPRPLLGSERASLAESIS